MAHEVRPDSRCARRPLVRSSAAAGERWPLGIRKEVRDGCAREPLEILMQKVLAIFLASSLFATAGTLAQSQPIENGQNRAIAPAEPYIHASVESKEGASLQQQSRPRSWAGRHPVVVGALIGVGAGVGFGAAVCDRDKDHDFPCKSVFGSQGAILGALAGFVVSVIRR